MKKYIFAILALVAMTFSASAAYYNYWLLVNTNDGNVVEYDFIYTPTVTFDGDDLVITSERDDANVRYNMADIKNFTFKKEESGINEVSTKADLRITIDKVSVTVAGLKDGAEVIISSISGMRVASAKASADGTVTIPLEGLGSGVFIATMPGNTFKFIR